MTSTLQEGKRHRSLFPYKEASVPCPYCGKQISQPNVHRHIAGLECPAPGQIQIPESQIRRLKQSELDQDPRFAPILQVPGNGIFLSLFTGELARPCNVFKEAHQESLF